jgi:hypothetical protein
MNKVLYAALASALLMSAPVHAQAVNASTFPQGEQSFDGKATTTTTERQDARASANVATPNVADNVIPNGPATANPPGAGASNSATLAEHGEVGTSANSNSNASATINQTAPASQ